MSVRNDKHSPWISAKQPNKCGYLEVEQTGASSQFYDKFSSSRVVDVVNSDRTDST